MTRLRDGKVLCFFLQGFGVWSLEFWKLDVAWQMWFLPAPASLTMGFTCQAWRPNNDPVFIRCLEFWRLGMKSP